MQYSFVFGAFLYAVVMATAAISQSPVKTLKLSAVVIDGKANNLKIRGFSVGRAVVRADEQVLISFLEEAWLQKQGPIHVDIPCECALLGDVGRCLFDRLPKETNSRAADLGSDTVLIVVSDYDFVGIAKRIMAGGSGGGRGRPPGGGDPPSKRTEPEADKKQGRETHTSERDERCKPEGEMCINSKGEVTFSLGCEGKFKFELASTGKMKMSLTNGSGQSFTTPVN
jgi:hypothetical protein